jgi:ABC-2 type transport system ATP-binding protein
MSIISIHNLVKEFAYPIKTGNWLHDLFKPQAKKINAVDGINLEVEKGESLAFIGPNGAGKSTTIKILTGILFPTSGMVTVAGFNPQQERKQLSMRIGTVFAQRSQLVFNLPVMDSFELFAKIYEIPQNVAVKRISELIDLLNIHEFINQPVRKLSLGQRMRAEIAVSLIHNPDIIFLDEPTIGLDVVAKKNLRDALVKLNTEKGITLFLTSHDAGDIEALAKRTVIINQGKVIVDDDTEKIRKSVLTRKIIKLQTVTQDFKIDLVGVEIISNIQNDFLLEVDTSKISINEVINFIVDHYEIKDINVEDPSLEETISSIYQNNRQ